MTKEELLSCIAECNRREDDLNRQVRAVKTQSYELKLAYFKMVHGYGIGDIVEDSKGTRFKVSSFFFWMVNDKGISARIDGFKIRKDGQPSERPQSILYNPIKLAK